ncbi:serine hydrolase [Fodinibius salsisoli]|uniref:Serine hydrolase n=1 Tax=Fodinibius salsisoli TaxID=2820877 RepID=A0ABT3PT13_9BACT|nr:serine hydrolase [Fodinibius salsisoli]MCW9708962.1 serine hydrolase [Fodinibius salsisoli]
MIVVDTNVIASMWVPNDMDEWVYKVLKKDDDWVVPLLWRSEFRNVLSIYLRKEILELSVALQATEEAEQFMDTNEFEVNSTQVMILVSDSSCSGYDCAFVAFGVLVAVVELVSGQTYEDFLIQHFFEPAGMSHTGSYGQHGGHALREFTVGAGPEIIGLPNIPPNWGPTPWLVKGSGGMYSNLDDLLKFYHFVRSDQLLDARYQHFFRQLSVNLDGSMRGFELFSIAKPNGDTVYLFINNKGETGALRKVSQALEQFMMD